MLHGRRADLRIITAFGHLYQVAAKSRARLVRDAPAIAPALIRRLIRRAFGGALLIKSLLMKSFISAADRLNPAKRISVRPYCPHIPRNPSSAIFLRRLSYSPAEYARALCSVIRYVAFYPNNDKGLLPSLVESPNACLINT
jgi:hypothetical protein